MKRIFTSLWVLLFVIGTDVTASAYDNEWKTLDSEINSFYNQGFDDHAVEAAKQTLQNDEQSLSPDDPKIARSLSLLAMLYKYKGQYAQAEPLFKRALTIDEKVFGEDDASVAIILGNLAELYIHQGQYAQAEPLFKRALAIDEKNFGRDHPDVAADMKNINTLHRKIIMKKVEQLIIIAGIFFAIILCCVYLLKLKSSKLMAS